MSKQRMRAKKLLKKRQRNCFYCGCILTNSNRTLEHLRPRALGGTDRADNLVLACKPCNYDRGCKPLAQWMRERGACG